ncbi:hypothetical protein HWV62_37815 [Athelia sp. TMB]|nr:hypothetical protein HWV62_37815 [Athelia sp. TMB]
MSTTPAEKPKSEETLAELEAKFTVGQYGVWRVLTTKSSQHVGAFWKATFAGLGLLRVFMVDIWQIGPALCLVVVCAQVWEGMQTSVVLYTSNRLLTAIEISLTKGEADVPLIVTATAAHIFCTVVSSLMRWYSDYIKPRLSQKVRNHFGQRLFRANLAQDLPTSQENSSRQQADPGDAWRALGDIISIATLCFSTLSQLGFIAHLLRADSAGPLFMACCLANPIFNIFTERSLWSKSYVLHANNEDYIRLLALKQLSEGTYRKDVIAGNLSTYILQEYAKAQQALGNANDDHAFSQFSRRDNPLWEVCCDLLDALPMVYYAANAIFSPRGFSLAAIAILQQTSYNLQHNFSRLLYDGKSFAETISLVKKIYESLEVENQILDGALPYPSADSKAEGMAIEVRDLTFEYSGSKSTKKALSNVSFAVKPGQLVVIVGTNGSGKSSLLKILNRLYTPTAGSVLVDGLPMSAYKLSDLREASADLSQDHSVYPLTIRENIGLGRPGEIGDFEEVRCAAQRGGALGFVEQFEDGFGTTLQPVYTAMSGGTVDKENQALSRKLLDKLEKRIEISGAHSS